ncbi:hypothetical protein BDK89_0830 [Ilumatobacter fluminis]|uniref:LppP/LprE lipoprotein n=1 Tax=Ilumatobacter fluminis TaxID=467091 RepID=A0A4R7HXE5_9ACTN|nr:hypothetical protein [Ilumatobacter fluminis]TDT15264.1 hypothetical protein BDK89_0830 [Ilumatobacter fluminis]
MSQRRLISTLAITTAMTLCACGSDDDSPTADSAATPPSPTIAETTAPTEPTTTTAPEASSPSTSPSKTAPAVATTTPPPTSTQSTEETTVPTDAEPVEIAIADLAGRLDVTADDIEIVSVVEVTWPDGGLGCPEPGMAYTQALVNGSRIVLSVDAIEYEYHSGQSGVPFYCPADRVTPPAAGGYGDI